MGWDTLDPAVTVGQSAYLEIDSGSYRDYLFDSELLGVRGSSWELLGVEMSLLVWFVTSRFRTTLTYSYRQKKRF